jgi:hypothetical protein
LQTLLGCGERTPQNDVGDCYLPNLNARRFPPPWSFEEQPACFIADRHRGRTLMPHPFF